MTSLTETDAARPSFRVQIKDDSDVVHTIMDSQSSTTSDNNVISGQVVKSVTDSLGRFNLRVTNSNGEFLNTFGGGELVSIYGGYRVPQDINFLTGLDHYYKCDSGNYIIDEISGNNGTFQIRAEAVYGFNGNANDVSYTPSHNGTLSTNLVAQYRMNDNTDSKTVTDTSANGFDGLSQNNTNELNVTGKINDAFEFDGSTDYIELNPSDTSSIHLYAFTSSITWFVNHNLNFKYVNFECFDDSGNIIQPEVARALDENSLYLEFGEATTGYVRILRTSVAEDYLHTQTISSTTWTISHNFDVSRPIVTVYDLNGYVIEPLTDNYTSADIRTLTFDSSQSGYAIVSFRTGDYTYTNGTSSTTWNITHSLNDEYPLIACFDNSHHRIEPTDISITDANTAVITWGEPVDGYARVVKNVYGDIADELAASDMSCFTWIKANSSGSGNDMILGVSDSSGVTNRILFFINTSGYISVQNVSTPIVTGSTNLRDDQWHHVGFTYDHSAGDWELFVDGNSVDTDLSTTVTVANTDLFVVGQEWDTATPSDFFDGSIDDLRIYDGILNSGDIARAYNSGSGTENINIDSAQLATDRFGSLNKCYYFDGIKNNIILDNTDGGLSPVDDMSFTIGAWIKTDTAGRTFIYKSDNGNATDNNDNYQFVVAVTTGYASWHVEDRITGQDVTVLGTTNLSDNEWHQVVGVFGAQESLFTDLVSVYWMESDAGDEYGSNDMTEYNSPTYTSGKFSNAVVLDGVNQYLQKTSFSGVNSRDIQTTSAWIKVDNLSSVRTITSYNGYHTFDVQTDGRIRVEAQGSTAGRRYYSVGTITTGTWYHVVARTNVVTTTSTRVVGDVELFINGVKQTLTTTVTGGNATTSTTLNIGAYDSTTNLMDGAIDDVAIWARALTDDEILQIYNDGNDDIRISKRIYVYADGVLEGTNVLYPDFKTCNGAGNAEIGGNITSNHIAPSTFEGYIDDVFFVKSMLTDSEVSKLYTITNNHRMTIPYNTTGKIVSSLDMLGQKYNINGYFNSYVELTDYVVINKNGSTISFWIKRGEEGKHETIFNYAPNSFNRHFEIDSGNDIRIEPDVNNAIVSIGDSDTLNDTAWHHVVLTTTTPWDMTDATLRCYYPFSYNDLSTTIDDFSSYGGSLTNTNATDGTNRFNSVNSCMSFNGSTSYLSTSSFEDVDNDEFTVALWVKASIAPSVDSRIVANTTKWELLNYSLGSRWHARLYGTGGDTFYPLSDTVGIDDYLGEWVHIAFTVSKTNDELIGYVNGIKHKTNTSIRTDIPSATNLNFYVGRYVSGNYFNGLIDDIMVFDKALTDDEITTLYSNLYNEQTSANVNLYIDGSHINSFGEMMVADLTFKYIGSPTTYSYGLSSQIDEIALWTNRVLSENEVSVLYNEGNAIRYASLNTLAQLLFKGYIDNVSYGADMSSGFYIDIDGRDYPELIDKTITGAHVAATAAESVGKILYNDFPDIIMVFWDGDEWAEATYNPGTGLISWSTSVTDYPTELINISYQHKKAWTVITDIFKRAGLDCYMWYFDEGEQWYLRTFTQDDVINNDESISYGSNLIGVNSYGKDNTAISNRVFVYGKQESDNIILLKSENDDASQADLWIKDLIITDGDLTTTDEVQDKADFELAKGIEDVFSGQVTSYGLSTLNPGELISVTVANCGITGYNRVQSFTHNLSNSGFTTSVEISKKNVGISDIFVEKLNPDEIGDTISNINSMENSYTVYFDEDPSIMTHLNTEEVSGRLKLVSAATVGTATSDFRITDKVVSQCEFRTYSNLLIDNDIYTVTADGGSNWETYTPGEVHTFTNTGSSFGFRMELHRSTTSATSPTYESVTLLYK